MDDLNDDRYSEDEVMYQVFDFTINVEVEPFVDWLRTTIKDRLDTIEYFETFDNNSPRERIIYNTPEGHSRRYSIGITSPLRDSDFRPPLKIEQFEQYHIVIQTIKTDVISVRGFSDRGEYWKRLRAILAEIKQTYEDDLIKISEFEESESQPVIRNLKMKQWDLIKEEMGYDKKLVELLWAGITDREIGLEIGISPRRVSNRLSDLRKMYESDIVPTREILREKGIYDGFTSSFHKSTKYKMK